MGAWRWVAATTFAVMGCTVVEQGGDAGPDSSVDGGVSICETNAQCIDDVFCNGTEVCRPADPSAGPDGCVGGSSPCGDDQRCDEAEDRCVTDPCANPDADGDGDARIACGGTDCDDDDPRRKGGNTEMCDAEGLDEDCDLETLGHDGDADGFVDASCCNSGPSGLICGRDCDDTKPTVNPSGVESCNGVDDDCDGRIDEEVLETFYEDMDGDTYGRADRTMRACTRPVGYVDRAGDCDDTDPTKHPNAPEVCDGADNDCNGAPDDAPGGCACTLDDPPRACGHPNGTGGIETRGICTAGLQSCIAGVWGPCEGAVFPRPETCDGLNEDCDDAIDEEAIDRVAYYRDADMDGFGDMSMSVLACPGAMPAGYVAGPRFDCDDTSPERDPDETETCDGIDEDCDGMVDEAPAVASCGSMAGHVFECRAGGVCAVASCPTNRGDCDGDPVNGCEISLLDNLAHCGGCGLSCNLECAGIECDDIVSVDAGGRHACAVRKNGGVVCWGSNGRGQLGDGTTVRRATPVAVQGLSNVVSVTAGADHSCALLTDGRGFCWGDNEYGQVGVPASSNARLVPVELSLTNIVRIDAGGTNTCAVTGAGGLYCWGRNNAGQLGNRSSTNSSAPRQVHDPDALPDPVMDAVDVAVGSSHACAVRADGRVLCWGLNSWRQLGDDVADHMDAACTAGFTDCSRLAVYATGLTDAVEVSAAGEAAHTCARTLAGEVYCWGRNASRQAAAVAMDRIAVPTRALTNATAIAAGDSFTCALVSANETQCWGSNTYGQLGRGSTDPGPLPPGAVVTLPDPTSIAAGTSHACAVRASGPTVCWGRDASAQLGDGDPTMDRNAPAPVAPISAP